MDCTAQMPMSVRKYLSFILHPQGGQRSSTVFVKQQSYSLSSVTGNNSILPQKSGQVYVEEPLTGSLHFQGGVDRPEVNQGHFRWSRDTQAVRERQGWGEKKPLILWFSSEITGSAAESYPTFLITDQSCRQLAHSDASKTQSSFIFPSIFNRAQNQTFRSGVQMLERAHTHALEDVCTFTSLDTLLGNIMGCPCSSAQKLPDFVNPLSALHTLITLSTKRLRQRERLCAEQAGLQRVSPGLNPALPSHSLTHCRHIWSDALYLSGLSWNTHFRQVNASFKE